MYMMLDVSSNDTITSVKQQTEKLEPGLGILWEWDAIIYDRSIPMSKFQLRAERKIIMVINFDTEFATRVRSPWPLVVAAILTVFTLEVNSNNPIRSKNNYCFYPRFNSPKRAASVSYQKVRKLQKSTTARDETYFNCPLKLSCLVASFRVSFRSYRCILWVFLLNLSHPALTGKFSFA